MSATSKAPLRLAGAVINSGNVNTGEQNLTLGGSILVCFFSGQVSGVVPNGPGPVVVGADVLLFSGAGRFKDVIFQSQMISGQVITVYDAGIVVSGGPWPLSGQKTLASFTNGVLSGAVGPVAGSLFAFDSPFTSGLCVSPGRSGAGFSVTYIPEANPSLANPG